jgi:hypothetical protein
LQLSFARNRETTIGEKGANRTLRPRWNAPAGFTSRPAPQPRRRPRSRRAKSFTPTPQSTARTASTTSPARDWQALTPGTLSLILRADDGSFGTSRFWAPQIFKDGADYLLTYTANEHVAVARSRALPGPYRQNTVGPIDNSERNIDSYFFRDDDGRYYLYHVRFRQGNFLWMAEFDLASGRIKPGTMTRCFDRTEAWEATPSYCSRIAAAAAFSGTERELSDFFRRPLPFLRRRRITVTRGRTAPLSQTCPTSSDKSSVMR